jgi:hypothetical protein
LLLKAARHKQELIFPGNTSCYATQKAFDSLIESLSRHTWIVYAKRPFAGPEQVLEYLGRYTHRIAISNNRIKSIDDGQVVFTYRDRADKDQIKEMTLSAEEFIRRFLLHILPEGFMKIRYFGFLSNKNKKEAIPLIRKLIGWKKDLPAQLKETVTEMILRLTGEDLTCCPRCLKGRMQLVRTMPQAMWNSS